MPRAGTGTKAKGKGPKAHKLPERFPSGEVLSQTQPAKKKWKLGEVIGQGGFGLIYTASDVTDGPSILDPSYVIKIEPLDNGPLFCEFHFYQRVAKPDLINEWTKLKKQRYLAVPQYYGSGQHKKDDQQYRFLVLQRLSSDLQKIFEQNCRNFSEKATFSIGLRMLDALEYIHDKGYCHADIKAANILLGYNKKTDFNQVYLVDYGLAYRYLVDGMHKPYKEDPKRAHDGTCEYASRDAHRGVCPSRRGDLEILGYCMLEWLSGNLPWSSFINDKDKVRDLKIQYMNDLPSLYRTCFGTKATPDGLKKYLSVVSKLAYDEKPDYNQLRQFLRSGTNNEWSIGLSEPSVATTSAKGVKRKSETSTPVNPKVRKVRPNSTPSATPSPKKSMSTGRGTSSKSTETVTNGSTRKTIKPKARARTPKSNGLSKSLASGSSTPASSSIASGEPKRKNKPAKVTSATATKSPAMKGKASRKPTAIVKKIARTPQKATGPTKRKRKAVQSSDTAVQTSPGFSLGQNGNHH